MTIDSSSPGRSINVRWLNYSESMEFLGVSRSTLDCWRRSNHLTFSRLPNGQLRIRRDVLNDWIEGLAQL
jgi:predicted site-specific integrase-resolvase